MSKKSKVYMTRIVPKPGREMLQSTCDVKQWESDEAIPKAELIKNVKGVDALYCMLTDPIDAEVLDAAGPQLKIVATMSVGFDHIDLNECKKRKIPVTHTPNVSTNAVAELAVTLLLATSRRVKEGIKAVENGQWGKWKPLWLCGEELDESTVGIVGLGRIGMATAERLIGFGVKKIVYFDYFQNPNASKIKAEFLPLDKVLEMSDFIISALNLTPETKEMFNSKTFKQMKKSAIFVNIGRGGVVNHDDLCKALKSGEIIGAGLDVTVPEPLPKDHPLVKLDNCVTLPHMGSNTYKSRSAMAELAAKNVLAALQGKPLLSEVKT